MLPIAPLVVAAAATFQLDPTTDSRLALGKEQLAKIVGDGTSGSCWASAVEQLKEGCRGMDEEQRSRLAVTVRSFRSLRAVTLAPPRRAAHAGRFDRLTL